MGNRAHNDKQAVVGEVRESSSVESLGSLDGVWWEGYSHRQMWDMIMRSKPAELFERANQWRAAAEKLVECNRTIQQRLNALLATWQGPAAEAAAASGQGLLNWAQEAATCASTVGTQLSNYGNALVSARLRMPQPQHRWAELSFRDGEGANVLEGTAGAHMLLQLTSDRLPTAQQARAAKRDAVQIMRELERSATEAERAMPQFTSAPQTTTEAPPRPITPLPSNPSPSPGPPSIFDVAPSFDGTASAATTTAQAVGDPAGYGAGESRGFSSSPGGGHGGGGYGGYGGYGAGGQVEVPGRGPAMRAGWLGGVVPGGWSAAGTAAAGSGGGFIPGAAGARTDGDEDTTKPLADYIEPDGIFTDNRPVSPPVWGA
jgi:uncharacterized protein YukE